MTVFVTQVWMEISEAVAGRAEFALVWGAETGLIEN